MGLFNPFQKALEKVKNYASTVYENADSAVGGLLPGGVAVKNSTPFIDKVREGYTGVDTALGGVLPGGSARDTGHLVGEVGRDLIGAAIPFHNPVTSAVVNATPGAMSAGAEDIARKQIPVSAGAETATAAIRAGVVDQGVDTATGKLLKKAALATANKAGYKTAAKLIPVAGQYIAAADLVSDTISGYDAYLKVKTGEGLSQHMAKTKAIRDDQTSVGSIFPTANSVMPKDGTIPEIVKGSRQLPWQEALNRVALFKENFNPFDGDWGVSELAYGDSNNPGRAVQEKSRNIALRSRFPSGIVGAATY